MGVGVTQLTLDEMADVYLTLGSRVFAKRNQQSGAAGASAPSSAAGVDAATSAAASDAATAAAAAAQASTLKQAGKLASAARDAEDAAAASSETWSQIFARSVQSVGMQGMRRAGIIAKYKAEVFEQLLQERSQLRDFGCARLLCADATVLRVM